MIFVSYLLVIKNYLHMAIVTLMRHCAVASVAKQNHLDLTYTGYSACVPLLNVYSN